MSVNRSKRDREELLRRLAGLRDWAAAQEDAQDRLDVLDALAAELNARRYGLVYERHTEQIDDILATHLPVLIERGELSCGDLGALHYLIEGDNLAALALLQKTHAGKIGVIYIDPPYNTGHGDFVYDDRRVDADDGYRHSKWLSFMSERLALARTLLAPDGVVFIQIDDNEYAQLKLLCDEIFGEENAIGPFIQNKHNSKNDTANIQKNHEYILVYRRRALRTGGGVAPTLIDPARKLREVIREGGRYYYVGDPITTRGAGGTLAARRNLGYTIYYHPGTGDSLAVADYDPARAAESDDEAAVYTDDPALTARGYVPIRPPRVRGRLGSWTWDRERFHRERDHLLIQKSRGGWRVLTKKYVDPANVFERDGRLWCRTPGNARSILDYSTSDGSAELARVLGAAGRFSNPKNVELVKYLIRLYPGESPWVLDFFAGSGTTGQAVLELNAEGERARRFILVQSGENDICRAVARERLARLLESGLAGRLRYCAAGFVRDAGRFYDEYACELLEPIGALCGLAQGGEAFLARDDDELAVLLGNPPPRGETLYLGRDILPDAAQEQALKNYDIRYVPDYFYREEDAR